MTQTRKPLTLTIVHQHPKVLLGMKKRGFGEGRWNGFGGKVGPTETIIEAAKRELMEEAGIEAQGLIKSGLIDFAFKDQSEILEVHIFRVENFLGQPQESEEMKPQWFYVDEIPFADMWPDDAYWLPLFLRRQKFTGRFLFDNQDKILDKDLIVVETLD